MIGGQTEAVQRLDPIFKTIAPGAGSAEPTPGRTRTDGTAPDGYLHCGPNGAGHFVKMVHNGVEYGMMAAIAEGLSIIKHANVGKGTQMADAETAPLRDPEAYQYDIDVGEVAEVWRRGSVVGSWLVDLTADAFARSPDLDGFAGRVSDSGEGRWTVLASGKTAPDDELVILMLVDMAVKHVGQLAGRTETDEAWRPGGGAAADSRRRQSCGWCRSVPRSGDFAGACAWMVKFSSSKHGDCDDFPALETTRGRGGWLAVNSGGRALRMALGLGRVLAPDQVVGVPRPKPWSAKKPLGSRTESTCVGSRARRHRGVTRSDATCAPSSPLQDRSSRLDAQTANPFVALTGQPGRRVSAPHRLINHRSRASAWLRSR